MEDRKYKVLIIEDEVKLARFVELELMHEGYEVIVEHNGRTGLEAFFSQQPDIILLDLMIPEISGIEVCRRIRRESNIPIIMITAKSEVMDTVAGLDSGANDYITKPFAIEEVFARMRVALRNFKPNISDMTVLTINNLVIDLSSRTVKLGNEEIELTKREFDLLVYLVKNKNIVITRDQILNQVWGYDYIGETNVVDVYIRYLRIKIDDKYNIKLIHTIRGVGYYVKEE